MQNRNIASLEATSASRAARLELDEVGARKIPRACLMAIAVSGGAGITISEERGWLQLDARMSAHENSAVCFMNLFQSLAENEP